jgi:signal transduction histidine kinase
MDGHGVMTVLACAGDLAFGALAFVRRSRSPLGGLVALLFFDAFTWNFAALAYELSGVELWHAIDRLFSSLMAAIALHVVVVFVGRSRSLRPLVVGSYLLFGGVGLFVGGSFWWKTLAGLGPVAMLVAITLLVLHRRRSTDASERARAELVLLALLIGMLSLTDLWYHELTFPLPRLGAISTLLAMSLFATGTLRLKLLGGAVPPVVALYAFSFGVFWVVAHLASVHWLEPRSSPWVLGAGLLVLLGVASGREIGRFRAVGQARTQELATLGRFSEQIAHDIKNPLAAVKGAVQFLREEHRLGRSLDQQTEFLALIEQQIERVERTLGDYQRMAKVEARPSPASLNTLVTELVSLQRHALSAGVTLSAELAAALPDCPLDRDLVLTALENLVRNANEALHQGGPITLRTAHDAAQDKVSVTVEDRGQGMDARELEQATLLFFTTKAHGTGLGLSFAERVARAHGGELDVASALGRGTSVTLTFRVHPEQAA